MPVSDMSDTLKRIKLRLQFLLCGVTWQVCGWSETLDRADCQHALAHVCDGHTRGGTDNKLITTAGENKAW